MAVSRVKEVIPPHYGVSAAFLEIFINENGGRAKVADMSTADVRNFIVKIQTASQQESYVERLCRQEKRHLVGPAGWYVVHCWKGRFLDLVDSVLQHLSLHELDPKSEFLWIDIMSYSQHSKVTKGEDSFFSHLQQGLLGTIKNLLMVLHPWDTAVALTRAWCLWEVFAATEASCLVECAMTADEHDRLLRDLQKDPSKFAKLISSVKSKYSTASLVEEKTLIHGMIEKRLGGAHDGYSHVDKVVGRALEVWAVALLQRYIKAKWRQDCELEAAEWTAVLADVYCASPIGAGHSSWAQEELRARQNCLEIYRKLLQEGDERISLAMSDVGQAYRKNGNLESARAVFEQLVELNGRVYGEEDGRTLQAKSRYAAVLAALGDTDDAEERYAECYSMMRRVLGHAHPVTLDTMQELGALSFRLEKFPAAAELLADCLAKRKRVCGEEHDSTMQATRLLGATFRALGRFAEALQLLRRAVGDDHVEVIECMELLAARLDTQGRSAEAAPLLEAVVAHYSQAFGAAAVETLQAQFSLAAIYDELRKFHEAKKLYQLVRAEIPPEHALHLQSVACLAVLYRILGELDASVQCQEECLLIRKQAFGLAHPTTISLMSSLALQLREQGELEQALQYYTSCYEARLQLLGPDNSETLSSQHALASMYLRDLERFDEAAELFSEIFKRRKAVFGKDHLQTKNAKKGMLEAQKMRNSRAGLDVEYDSS